jgi:hypothetical protein
VTSCSRGWRSVTLLTEIATGKGKGMQVVAYSTPASAHWCWRIVNYAGEVIEESFEKFPTIAAALARGRVRLKQMDVVDHSTPRSRYRSGSRPRAT